MKQGGNHSGGFTIVETLIVLTVTSVLAASALLLVNGRQNKTEFQTSITATQQQLQQIMNETASGYYPSSGYTCSGNTAGAPPTISFPATPPPDAQGTNNSCIFMGKVLQLAPGSATDTYMVYALAGNRQYNASGTTQEAATVAQAAPVAVYSSAHPENAATIKLQGGLTVQRVTYKPLSGGGAVDAGAFGFLNSLAAYDAVCNGICSGGQQLGLYAVKDGANIPSSTFLSPTNEVSKINSPANLIPASEVNVCLTSGTTDQSGLFTIGNSNNSGLGVSLKIYNGSTCS